MDVINLIGGLLYQWDTGRKVKIVPRDGITVDEVHVSNGLQDALIVEPYTEEGEIYANIPNILLQAKRDVSVYVVMYNESGEQTVCSRNLVVNGREKPEDYVYTEDEIKRWEKLEKAISTAVLTTPQTLTDEQRAQARANIGAIEEDVLAVKGFPENFEGWYGTMGCNIFELEQGNYVDNSNSCTLYAVADDGTFKILGIAKYNDVVYILRYPASIHVIQKNMTIAVSLADVSTADNIAVTYSYNKNYIETSNTREYTPTSDYHPATKKYVDDTAATAKTTAETAQSTAESAQSTAESALSGLAEKITAPQTAEVGQVISVKAVDDEGKANEFECVSQKNGNWRLIRVLELDEECTRVDITLDDNGVPFSCSSMWVGVYGYSATEESTRCIMLTNGKWGTQDPYTTLLGDMLPTTTGYTNPSYANINTVSNGVYSIVIVTQPFYAYKSTLPHIRSNIEAIGASAEAYADIHSMSFDCSSGFGVRSRFVLFGIDKM